MAIFCLKAVAADKWEQNHTRYRGLVALVCSCLHLVGKVKGAPKLWISTCGICVASLHVIGCCEQDWNLCSGSLLPSVTSLGRCQVPAGLWCGGDGQ